MSEYIKICPECQHHNSEAENTCLQCNAFIGLEDSILQGPTTENNDKEEVHCYLTLSGKTYMISHQSVLGQQDKNSLVQIQIADIEGVAYIHRQHCRFEYNAGQWHIIAINQLSFGHAYTNPSLLNGKTIPLESPIAMNEGDQIQLSGVKFTLSLSDNT